MIQVYGIANCDSVKKVRAWLDAHGVNHAFHDYKKQGVPEVELTRWVSAVGWDVVLNRKGTTWRALDPSVRASVIGDTAAIAVMLANPSTIKRPVVTRGASSMIVGVDFEGLAALIAC